MSDFTKKLIAWKKGDMSFNVASCLAKENVRKSNNLLWDCAEMLRNEILQPQSNPLEEQLTVEETTRGEVDPLGSVKEFFQILYVGPFGDLPSRKERLVNSTSADLVCACSADKLLHIFRTNTEINDRQ